MGDMICYIDGKKQVFHNGRIKADFKAEFPGFEADAERLFSTMETINTELFSGTEDPEPPYDMSGGAATVNGYTKSVKAANANLLFWKDYSSGYLTHVEKQKLISFIDDYRYVDSGDGEGYYKFEDYEDVVKTIEAIRKRIGIKNDLP